MSVLGKIVCIVDSFYSSIAGHGDIPVSSSLLLSSVLHVSNFTLNLLSISHLTKCLNCIVVFFPSYCLFHDLKMKTTISTGHESDGLYLVDSTSQLSIASPTRNDVFPNTTDELF